MVNNKLSSVSDQDLFDEILYRYMWEKSFKDNFDRLYMDIISGNVSFKENHG